jgi:hypothetical protein
MAGQTPRLETVAPNTPASIADVIAIALSPKPNDRFTSATAMRSALVHAAREAQLTIDAPQAALRSRAALPAADASGQVAVLGGVGLGVAPQAMLGPGNPAAIAAFDAQKHRPPPVVEAPRVESVPKLPPIPTNGASPPEAPIVNEGTGTLAAMPSPYAPPYGPPPEPMTPPPNPNFGSTAMVSPGGTDAGFVSPFATDRGFKPEAVPDLGTPGSHEMGPITSEAPRRRGVPWIPILIGVVGVGAIIAAVVWATQGTPAPPAAPQPAATKDPDEEEETKAKKKKPKPEPTPSVAPTPTVTAPVTTTKPLPKPSVKQSTSTSVPPSISVPPSVTIKPPPSVSTVPPDIIQLPPLPWPPP